MKPVVVQSRRGAVSETTWLGRAGLRAATAATVMAMGMFAIAAAPARAQYRPMPPDPYDPHAATLPAAAASQPGAAPGAGPAGVAQQQGALPPVGIPQVVTENLQSNIDYPATEVRMVPVAKAQQVGARSQ